MVSQLAHACDEEFWMRRGQRHPGQARVQVEMMRKLLSADVRSGLCKG